LAVMIGGFALFYGSQAILDYEWDKSNEEFRYADPPVIQVKNNLKINHIEFNQPEKEKEKVFLYTYEDFKKTTAQLDQTDLVFDIRKSSNLGEEFVLFARAENEDAEYFYEPSLLIIISDYGSDDLISEIEFQNDNHYLRILNPFEDHSALLAENFRRKGLPYAINSKGLNSETDLQVAMRDTYYPKYNLEITERPIEFPVALGYDEIQLKMKGIIYDAIIESYKTGYQTVVFKATIKNLKCLQTTLNEMLPLPVKLLSYPLWRDNL